MDTGIVGFFALAAALVAVLACVVRRQRQADRFLLASGFREVAELPASLRSLVDELFEGEIEGRYRATGSPEWGGDAWIVHVNADRADDSSVAYSLLATAQPLASAPSLVAWSYAGARPSSWLGRVGLRLAEMGSGTLGRRHRLSDASGLLSSGTRGFVAWAGREADVSELIPHPALELMRDPAARRICGLAVEGGLLAVWSPRSHVDELIPYSLRLRRAWHSATGAS